MHGRRGGEVCGRMRRSLLTRGAGRSEKGVDCGSGSSPVDWFVKDGRKICVGDCALFRSPQESPHFIGIIRSLTQNKEDSLQLCVNRLYRPIELKLGKGILQDAVPNEVFYSFHKDEISAASLLHPCKVAFLPKGVELPSGISSFVCRRIFDTDNRCLRWLSDNDYIDQEEVNQLLYKTQTGMHATAQSGGRSPKPINGPTQTSQLKSGSDNHLQTATSIPSQVKGRKRERTDHGSEPVKRERGLKTDEDSAQLRSESILEFEISRITEKGALADSEGVEKLVQLMQPNRVEKKLELVSRSMFASVIAATENFDCLSRFVQLKGLPVLDQWLQDVHKGKVGDGSPKDGDKSVEEFLLVLLRALDKLPVNLQALQMCNIGKSVNHLRTYKNSDIQRKARSLVDTWKKRVEAEMNVIDAKSGSSQAVSWQSRSRLPEGSHGGNRQCGGPSEGGIKSSTQLSASKIASSKPAQTEINTKHTSSYPGSAKVVPSPASGKDVQPRSVVGSNPNLPSTIARDERSSSSSQSHNNSQSCSSDHAKTTGFSGKEDARNCTPGSVSVNKVSGGSSRPRRSVNGYPGFAPSGSPRETGSSRNSNFQRNLASEKMSQSGLTCEKPLDVSTIEASSHKLIVKIPNRGRSPAQSASMVPIDDQTVMHSRASSPVLSEKHDQSDHVLEEKADANQGNNTSDVKTESWQSNDFKDILTASDEGDGSPDAIPEGRYINGDDAVKLVEISKTALLSSENGLKSGKLHDASFSSINALIESCVNYSQVNELMSAGDDGGMNLLASVAAGEMCKSNLASPSGSSASPRDEFGMNEDCKSKAFDGNDLVREQCHSNNDLNDTTKQGNSISIVPEQAGEQDKPFSSRLDFKPAIILCPQIHEQSDVVSSALSAEDKVLNVEESKQHDKKVTVVTSSVAVKIEGAKVKESSLSVDDQVNDISNCPEVKKEAAAGVPSHASSDIDSEKKADMREARNNGSCIEQKPSLVIRADVREGCNGSSHNLPSENAHKLDSLKLEGMEIESHGGKQNICKDTGNISSKESLRGQIACDEAAKINESESSPAHAALSSAAETLHVNKKPKFDLNEGFSSDDGKLGDPMNLEDLGFPVSARIVNPLPFPVASMSSGLPASITVAAAAKGPFVPPVDLLRSKRELGWKGSAATSAFRPAEPRKALEMPPNTPDVGASKRGRPILDFDLNVADERIVEDVVSRSSAYETASTSSHATTSQDFALKKSLVSPPRCSVGLDLDLNQVDEAVETWHPASSGRGPEVPFFPAKSQSSLVAYPNLGPRRDFDLNDGPVVDEIADSSLHNQHSRSSLQSQPFVTGLRTSTEETGTFSSWFPAGNAFPPVSIPSIMSDRGDHQPFPFVQAGGPQRVLGPPTGAIPFSPDLYRGSVLSSSPAIPFPSFQYPVFPFGTGFPLPSASISGGSTTYMDSLSNGRLGFSAPNSQLAGPPAVTSHYARPFVVSLPDGSNNMAVGSNSKWGRQGLDLNAGPGAMDMEGRDESSSPLVSRQLSVASSQAITDEQGRFFQQMTGGVLKRKDNAENFRYKQSSWQ